LDTLSYTDHRKGSRNNDRVEPGRALIAPGGRHILFSAAERS
jgi:chemotaxis response regulator CheB